MTFTSIRYSVAEGVALLALDIPAKLNPLAVVLQQELLQAYEKVRNDASVRALVLTGTGKAFCVGADLDSMRIRHADGKSVGDRTADMMNAWTNRLATELQQLPVPVVAAVNGPAAGAGVGLALAADVVIAARSAYFYLPFLPRLGIAPDLGSTWILPRLVGRARFMAISLLDERLSAERAAEWGLIWSCVDDEALAAEALSLAKRLARLPVHATQEARRAYDASQRHDLGQQLAYETARQRDLVDRPTFAEGVLAFSEKRKPVFPGR